MIRRPPRSTLLSLHDALPIFEAADDQAVIIARNAILDIRNADPEHQSCPTGQGVHVRPGEEDRKSTRLNSSHANISYAVFCLKKKTIIVHHFFSATPYHTYL